jgi:hypothetical protein
VKRYLIAVIVEAAAAVVPTAGHAMLVRAALTQKIDIWLSLKQTLLR